MRMLKFFLPLVILFSFAVSALEVTPVTFRTETGVNYKRQRTAFEHDHPSKTIVVYYTEYAELAGSGEVIGVKQKKRYKLTGSYYFELSLATSGETKIGDFLDTAIDARLGAYTGDVQAGIEAGRAAKDAEMIPLGYTP